MDRKKLKNKLIEILYQAGELALTHQKNFTSEIKADNTLVTSGDLAVNDFLIKNLRKISNNILSEELYELDKLNQDSVIFVIDPIDGTISYSKKQDTWSIILSVLDTQTKETIMGFVYQASLGKLYYSVKNEGAFLLEKDQEIKLEIDKSATKGIISPNKPKKELNFLNKQKIEEYYTKPAAALKVLEVVTNNAIVYPNFAHNTGVWDFLAPKLILEEAGGVWKAEKEMSIYEPKLHFDIECWGK